MLLYGATTNRATISYGIALYIYICSSSLQYRRIGRRRRYMLCSKYEYIYIYTHMSQSVKILYIQQHMRKMYVYSYSKLYAQIATYIGTHSDVYRSSNKTYLCVYNWICGCLCACIIIGILILYIHVRYPHTHVFFIKKKHRKGISDEA